MSQYPQAADRPGLSSTSKMSFAVAACAFAAAGIGLLVNQWMSGWMAVGGMAGVGLFYLAVGLLNLGSNGTMSQNDQDFAETAAHRLSGVGNVDDLAVRRSSEKANDIHSETMANARQ
jgi:hypothetical protein